MALFGYKITRAKQTPQKLDNSFINKVNQALFGVGLSFVPYEDNRSTYLDKGYNINPDVFSVITQKSNELTRIPYYIKSVKNKQKKERYNSHKYSTKGINDIRMLQLKNQAFEEDEFPMPLEKPNPNQTWRQFFALYDVFMDTVGDFYIYLVSPENGANAGEPKQMYILPSHLMQIVLKPNIDVLSDEDVIDYYILTEGQSYIRFEAENVVHIKTPNPNYDLQGSHLYGVSRLRAALKNIQASNEALDLNSKTLRNGGAFGFIHAKGAPLLEPQAAELKSRLIEMDADTSRLSKIAGSSAELAFTRISLTTDELKPFDYLEYNQKQICNVLGWDDKLLNNDNGAKYDNYKVAIRRSISMGISPYLRLFEEAFNTEILPRFKAYRGKTFIFDETELPEMQEDTEGLRNQLNDAIDRGVISKDEYRTAINYTAIESEEMQMHTVARQEIPIDSIGENLDMSNDNSSFVENE